MSESGKPKEKTGVGPGIALDPVIGTGVAIRNIAMGIGVWLAIEIASGLAIDGKCSNG